MVGGMRVGDAWQRGVHGGGLLYVAGEMATAADGTHPTSMHSCLSNECKDTYRLTGRVTHSTDLVISPDF